MGKMGRIYTQLLSQDSHQGDGKPDYGVKKCHACNGKGCQMCFDIGYVSRTAEDEENDYADEMERRGDAEREERINNR